MGFAAAWSRLIYTVSGIRLRLLKVSIANAHPLVKRMVKLNQ